MIRAGIDIGTNTILLLIAEVENGRVQKVIEDHVTVVRLGQGVDQHRAFQPEAMERARSCFAEYAGILKKFPGIACRAVATSGSRDAKNAGEFFQEIQKKFGFSIEVISGAEEARLSFLGSVPENTQDLHSVAVLDIGGGSTEVVGLGHAEDLFRYSFDMGCVRMSERFLKSDPALANELFALRAEVKKELLAKKNLFQQLKNRHWIGVAGTATYLASSDQNLKKFDPEKVHGYTLSRKKLHDLLEKLQTMSSAERLGMGGMDRGRADVIVSGAIILEEVLSLAGVEQIWISTRGLRYGVVLG